MKLPTICQKSLTFSEQPSSEKNYIMLNVFRFFFKRKLFPSPDSIFTKSEMSQNLFPKGNS